MTTVVVTATAGHRLRASRNTGFSLKIPFRIRKRALGAWPGIGTSAHERPPELRRDQRPAPAEVMRPCCARRPSAHGSRSWRRSRRGSGCRSRARSVPRSGGATRPATARPSFASAPSPVLGHADPASRRAPPPAAALAADELALEPGGGDLGAEPGILLVLDDTRRGDSNDESSADEEADRVLVAVAPGLRSRIPPAGRRGSPRRSGRGTRVARLLGRRRHLGARDQRAVEREHHASTARRRRPAVPVDHLRAGAVEVLVDLAHASRRDRGPASRSRPRRSPAARAACG